MCWQCVQNPDQYLIGAEFVGSEDTGDQYPPITLKWKGKVYKTNPGADWLFAGHAEPDDFDAEGIPYFEEVLIVKTREKPL